MKTINTFYEDFNGLSEFVRNNQNILRSNENSAVLVQVFNGQCDQEFFKRLLAEIAELVPDALILGTTTSGEIINGQVNGLKTVLSFSIFKRTVVKAGFFPKGNQNDFDLGRKIASTLGGGKAKLLILFATGRTMNSTAVLKGVESVFPGLPVTGGNAGHNALGCFVSCNGQITSYGVVGVVLEGENLKVSCYSHLGWQPIGKEMTVTKVDGLRVYTIDNIPVYQIYRKYLGLDRIGNFSNAVEYPLLVNRNGSLLARTPDIYYEDDSISFVAELVEGEKVRLSFGDIGMISEATVSLCQEIRQHPAESVFVYSCESRRGFLQELSKIETEPLQEIANTSGFFTYGEFYYSNKTNQVLNATMTVVVLAETAGKVLEHTVTRGEENSSVSYKFSKDKIVERSSGVLKALTHLINTVTDELVTANEKLKYAGQHDSLTGLYNRAFFEQEMEFLETQDGPVGIVVCDLDCLKVINDTFGHSFGDQMICKAANVITEACRKEDIVARIGGDEFAIIVTNATLSGLKNIRKRIVSIAAKTRSIQPENLVYLSVGFALKTSGGEKSLDGVFKIADANMYSHKMRNKQYSKKTILGRTAFVNNDY
ncbi:diguanylate cyclase (GGDEF)-like protein [Sporomusaceae bacterium BoRhaA]|uniref:sensor domain-containing diguanylate cyclase n=1 Tax=Pelorhabdus rhamnosifermentans TaxID=2772457 RepID=UPI001C05F210|nr:FIST N-terminal domain-containing protein [Pelorhabdus rhamnosifermentans]MBU2703244.1 diguanylate cyclase (GGDEF)-like protein [Pelorhabdus rhamnosifermentans]